MPPAGTRSVPTFKRRFAVGPERAALKTLYTIRWTLLTPRVPAERQNASNQDSSSGNSPLPHTLAIAAAISSRPFTAAPWFPEGRTAVYPVIP